jgi:hypothetical protein
MPPVRQNTHNQERGSARTHASHLPRVSDHRSDPACEPHGATPAPPHYLAARLESRRERPGRRSFAKSVRSGSLPVGRAARGFWDGEPRWQTRSFVIALR